MKRTAIKYFLILFLTTGKLFAAINIAGINLEGEWFVTLKDRESKNGASVFQRIRFTKTFGHIHYRHRDIGCGAGILIPLPGKKDKHMSFKEDGYCKGFQGSYEISKFNDRQLLLTRTIKYRSKTYIYKGIFTRSGNDVITALKNFKFKSSPHKLKGLYVGQSWTDAKKALEAIGVNDKIIKGYDQRFKPRKELTTQYNITIKALTAQYIKTNKSTQSFPANHTLRIKLNSTTTLTIVIIPIAHRIASVSLHSQRTINNTKCYNNFIKQFGPRSKKPQHRRTITSASLGYEATLGGCINEKNKHYHIYIRNEGLAKAILRAAHYNVVNQQVANRNFK